jgi:acyl-CoA dehydrogenase
LDVLEQFRADTRAWLETNCPQSQRQPVVPEEQYWGGRKTEFASDDARVWFERMRDKGWTAPEWPSEYGGGGLDLQHAKVLKQEMKALGARPPIYGLGLWMLGPALLEHGNEEQKNEHVTGILRGESRWCQGYSEPGAGSDLASLQCRAEDRGDHFLVNGSKIWTSAADRCDWIFCLVRTDLTVAKQEGISFLLIDMIDPGISTTPIQLISGESEFCQTFFDNVKVPKENLVGKLNGGWTVAKSLLKHERKLMSEMVTDPPRAVIPPLELARQFGKMHAGKLQDELLRRDLTRYEMDLQAVALTQFRIFEEQRAGTRSHAPLVMKYSGTELEKRKSELAIALMGSSGLAWEGDNFTETEIAVPRVWAMSKAMTVAGGTSEIQLNLIAKNVLGLPTESRDR